MREEVDAGLARDFKFSSDIINLMTKTKQKPLERGKNLQEQKEAQFKALTNVVEFFICDNKMDKNWIGHILANYRHKISGEEDMGQVNGPLDRQLIKLLDDYVNQIVSWKELAEGYQTQAEEAMQEA